MENRLDRIITFSDDLAYIIDENIRLRAENEKLRKAEKEHREFLCNLVDENQKLVTETTIGLLNSCKEK